MDETYCFEKKVECPQCKKSHVDFVCDHMTKSAVCTCRDCGHIFYVFVKTEVIRTVVTK